MLHRSLMCGPVPTRIGYDVSNIQSGESTLCGLDAPSGEPGVGSAGEACSKRIASSAVTGTSQAQTAVSAASVAQVWTDSASNRIRCFEHGIPATEFASSHSICLWKMTLP